MTILRYAAACALLLCAGGARSASAQPLSAAFTYQGELRTAGVPAAGLHDMRFRLFDAAAGGTQVGTTLCIDNVTLSQGRFTVVLDFLAQYAGDKRFLEIEVRVDTGLNCVSGAGFTPLSPRQELTATPNASFALTAGMAAQATTASTATTATSAATATNASQLNGQGPAFYQNAANLSSGTIPSGRLGGTYSGVLVMDNPGNSFTGLGAGLVGLSASNISAGTLSAARLPVPMTLGGSSTGPIIDASNSSTAVTAAGVSGLASAVTGDASGVMGQSNSPSGFGVTGVAAAATGSPAGVFGRSAAPFGTGVHGRASATTGQAIGGFFESAADAGTAVAGFATGNGGNTRGGWFRVTSTSGKAVVGHAEAFVGPTWGGQFWSESADGIGVEGSARRNTGSGTGVLGSTATPGGFGVRGIAGNNASTVVNYGGHFSSSSTAGRGVYGVADADSGVTYGVVGESASPDGVGVEGIANAFGGGQSYGVIGRNWNTGGTGVLGIAANGASVTVGVAGQSASTSGFAGHFRGRGGDAMFIENYGTGRGVHVVAPSDTSVWAETTTGFAALDARNANAGGFAVRGANSATTGNAFGVVGESASAAGWGLYAFGRSGASGVKAFRIDHPEDPEGKYLLHYSAESPEVINFYSETVTLDGGGGAVVELPRYFARVNTRPRYQLTAVGAPMPMLHVAEEISESILVIGAAAGPGDAVPTCTFRIAGGVAGGKVSWEVKAVRNDRWMQRNGAPVEAEKVGTERGTYQHPDLYGQGTERGVTYRPAQQKP